jgi:hypothetical protein
MEDADSSRGLGPADRQGEHHDGRGGNRNLVKRDAVCDEAQDGRPGTMGVRMPQQQALPQADGECRLRFEPKGTDGFRHLLAE